MRILHIITTLGSGGAEKMLVDIVREMINQNIYCEVAVLSKSHDFFGEELKRLEIPIYYGETGKVYSIKNILFLKKILKNQTYDCIHTHLYATQLFTPLAMKIASKSIPLVTTEHSTHNKRRDKAILKLLDRWMYKKHDGIIAITKDTYLNLVTYMPSVTKKTIVIENGIDIKRYSLANPCDRKDISLGLQSTDKIVLMVAAMREQKDQETLIRASKLLSSDYRIVFVGDGKRVDEVKQYARDHGSSSIIFLGIRRDIPEIMKASDVFVLSSHWEGFGLVTVEAAASGLPVIASDVEGLNDVVTTIGGQLFKLYDENELAEKIIFAVEHKNQHLDVSNYTIQKTVERYLKFYKEKIELYK